MAMLDIVRMLMMIQICSDSLKLILLNADATAG
jgi:hypothetical protein